jgi:hypothetical protein
MGKHGSYPRVPGDFYPTPDWAVTALAEHVELRGALVWEPATGTGCMALALRAAGANVYCSDIVDRGFPLDALIDFTTITAAPAAFNGTVKIVSNPPYDKPGGRRGRLAERFIEIGLHLIQGGGLLAFLLPVEFDSAKTRPRLFADCALFASKITLNERIVWFAHPDDPRKERPKENHAWFLWRSPPPTARTLLYASRAGRPPATSPAITAEGGMTMTKPKLVPETPETAPKPADKVVPITVGNPNSIASFIIDQSHMEDYTQAADEKACTVNAERPPKGTYFTVPKAEEGKPNSVFMFTLEIPGRDPYAVDPEVAKNHSDEDVIRPILYVRYVTMLGEEALWPIKLTPPDQKSNTWNKSAKAIADIAATGRWVRLISKQKLGRYEFSISPKTFEQVPPKFSEQTTVEMIDAVFDEEHRVRDDKHEVWTILAEGSTK